MKTINSTEELQEELENCLKSFMEKNKQFNLQGSIQGENGLTVHVLIDFGIEDRDNGSYYVGTVSIPFEENLEYMDEKGLISENKPLDELESDKLLKELGEADIFLEAENKTIQAIRKVFDIQRRYRLRSRPEISDVDISSTIPIMYGEWKTREKIEAPKPEKREFTV
jgi:hypothetical protein